MAKRKTSKKSNNNDNLQSQSETVSEIPAKRESGILTLDDVTIEGDSVLDTGE